MPQPVLQTAGAQRQIEVVTATNLKTRPLQQQHEKHEQQTGVAYILPIITNL